MSSDFDLMLDFVKDPDIGCVGTLVQTVEGEYDPATGTVGQTVNEIPVEGVLMDLMLRPNGLSVKFNTMVEAGDKEFYMRPPNKTNGWPDPVEIHPATDRIRIGNNLWQIVTLKEVNPTGLDPLLVSVYLRR